MHRGLFGIDTRVIDALAAETGKVSREDFVITSASRNADPVILTGYRREVADNNDFIALLIPAQERDDVLFRVVAGQPVKAIPAAIQFPHCGCIPVELEQFAAEILELAVLVKPQQIPSDGLFLAPLVKLCQLTAHEQQFLAGMGIHICDVGAQVIKLLLIIARHLVNQRALAMYHLVMRQRQNEVLGESVSKAESKVVMHTLAEERVGLHIFDRVVHPAHIPLEVKSQTVFFDRMGNLGECGRFLSDGQNAGESGVQIMVKAFEELDCLEVPVAAVDIGHPAAVLLAVIQIQHRSDRIDSETVDMVPVHPVCSRRNQEGHDLTAAIVKDHRTPVRVFTLTGIGVFIAGCTVKPSETVRIPREMCGNPVHQNTDTGLMAAVNKTHQHFRGSIPGSRREIAGDLVSPRAVERVFRQRHQFDMGITHLLNIRNQLIGQAFIIQRIARLKPSPASGVHLIDIHRFTDCAALFTLSNPGAVTPLVIRQVVNF